MQKQRSAVENALVRLEAVLIAERTLLEDVSAQTLAVLVKNGFARRLVEITDAGRKHLSDLRGEISPMSRSKVAKKA